MRTIPLPPVFFRHAANNPLKRVFLQLIKISALLLAVFLALEGALAFYGYVFSYYAQGRVTEPRDKNKIIIFCEGDAFTWGLGGKSYPQQLEEMLNARAGRDIFQVINNGVPDKSVGQSAREMPALFRQYRPDAVILLSGGTQEYEWSFAAKGAQKNFSRRIIEKSRVLSLAANVWRSWGLKSAAEAVSDWAIRQFGGHPAVLSRDELFAEIEKLAAHGDTSGCLKMLKANRAMTDSIYEAAANSVYRLSRVLSHDAMSEYIVGLLDADLVDPAFFLNIVDGYKFIVSRMDLKVLVRAQELCELGVRKWPLRPEPFLCAANVSARPGKYKLAEAYARKAIALEPSSPDGYMLLSDIYAHQGDYATAERAISALQNAGPAVRRKIAEIQFKSGKYDLAAKNMERYLSDNPADAEAVRLIGAVYRKKGQLEKGIFWYRRLADLHPEDPQALYDLAELYFELNQALNARQYCQKALDLQPANSEILFSCQSALERLGDKRKLRAQNRSAVEYSPSAEGETWQPTPEDVLQNDIRRSVLSIFDVCRNAEVPLLLSVSPNRHIVEAAQFAAQHGILFMDIDALFSANGGIDRYISFDMAHCNTDGYRLIARMYADEIWRLLESKISARLKAPSR